LCCEIELLAVSQSECSIKTTALGSKVLWMRSNHTADKTEAKTQGAVSPGKMKVSEEKGLAKAWKRTIIPGREAIA
jgi:hypothetical protein